MDEVAEPGSPRWRDPAWRPAIDAWVHERLAAAGVRATGDVMLVRARPWAAVLTVATEAGPHWVKASAVGVAHEAGVYEVIGRHSPEHALVPLGLDLERGWLLLPDGGPTLRDVPGASTDLAQWERMLVEYAALQRALEPHAGELLAAGVPDARPQRLPGIRDALLADPEVLLLGQPDGLTPDQRAALVAGAAAYAARCADLAATGVAPTLQHDDLHDNNVFGAEHPGGPLRVFDWGDSVLGHPFGTLLVTLRVVANGTGLPYGAPELLRLRDAYLEAWTDVLDRAALAEACALAVRVGGVLRADCYRRALLEATPAARAGFADGVAFWLLETDRATPLDPSPA